MAENITQKEIFVTMEKFRKYQYHNRNTLLLHEIYHELLNLTLELNPLADILKFLECDAPINLKIADLLNVLNRSFDKDLIIETYKNMNLRINTLNFDIFLKEGFIKDIMDISVDKLKLKEKHAGRDYYKTMRARHAQEILDKLILDFSNIVTDSLNEWVDGE